MLASLYESPFEFTWIALGMKNRDNNETWRLTLEREVDQVLPAPKPDDSRETACLPIPFRIFGYFPQQLANLANQPLAQSRLAPVIIVSGLVEFFLGLAFDDDLVSHQYYSPSATTSSKGRHRSGCV